VTTAQQPGVSAGPWRAAGPPEGAAPVLAVDVWRREHTGTDLRMTMRVRVRGDDPNLRGHFPGLAIYPGVFIIEALCQVMALAVHDDRGPVLRRIESARFLAPLFDGCLL
jgi:3-hydroxyacyl-[acyl-carrier-protein] dehydratase